MNPSRASLPGAPASGSRSEGETLAGLARSILDTLTDAILVVDRDQRVVFANRRYLEAFGAVDGVAGRPCHDVMRCPERHHARGACPACRARDERVAQHEIRAVPDVSGVPRRWEASFNPVLDTAGRVSHVIEIWRDVNDRVALEGRLAHSERLASVGMLAAGVGHEINNPLASILAGVESLVRTIERCEEPEALREEALAILRLIEGDVTRCRETTDKLMLLAQPYRGTRLWVDVNRAIRDTAALLRHQMNKQGITWSETLDPALPAIWAGDSGVRGICMNLMMNAVQAMPRGGVLAVTSAARDGAVEIVVEDEGPGIAPEHLARIWDPFFTTKPAGQGTGLGLFVTHGVVARHGGTIRVENREGGGARFVVRLPTRGGEDAA